MEDWFENPLDLRKISPEEGEVDVRCYANGQGKEGNQVTNTLILTQSRFEHHLNNVQRGVPQPFCGRVLLYLTPQGVFFCKLKSILGYD